MCRVTNVKVHYVMMRCSISITLCWFFYVSTIKVHRSISLVSLRYVQYSMCYDASSTGLLLHIKCNVQWQCLYFYYALFNSLVLSQIQEKTVPTMTGVIGMGLYHTTNTPHTGPTRLPGGRSERTTRLKQNEMRNLGCSTMQSGIQSILSIANTLKANFWV